MKKSTRANERDLKMDTDVRRLAAALAAVGFACDRVTNEPFVRGTFAPDPLSGDQGMEDKELLRMLERGSNVALPLTEQEIDCDGYIKIYPPKGEGELERIVSYLIEQFL